MIYVKTNASDGSDFFHGQRRQDPADGLDFVRQRAQAQGGSATEDLDLDLFTLADCCSDINGAVDGLSDEDCSLVAARDESDKTCLYIRGLATLASHLILLTRV